ncbi:cupin domain-containing protein [Sulfurimonas microaerophilic]|uniref:cupin domain-containing protein n=1 Tax=Sulfurimonas microaerophilic TaxID=3058392 RepID=UPI00271484A9|nr:cupin domain-containing protein [Sulfurimonas sp. hsl 1-7]
MSSKFFDYTLPELDSENFTTLLEHKNVKISRIISNTLKTEQTFLSDKDEWVIVLQGCAKLEMNGSVHKLTKGESLFIPANTEHKLLKTKKVVIWLAVYID